MPPQQIKHDILYANAVKQDVTWRTKSW